MAKREDPAATQTAVVKHEETLQALLRRYEPTIKAALPAHVTAERMLSIARTAIAVNPGLRRCSPLSVICGVVLASRLGLECDGLLGEAYLVPRWNKNTGHDEASFQLGYKGMHKLSIQHPDVEHVETRLVHEKDKFSLVYEPAPKFSHEPAMGDRGAVIAAYTYIRYKDGRVEVFEPMTVKEALDIRDRFGPKDREGNLVGPWKTDTNEMIRKTAFRRNWKWMPKAVEMREAMRAEVRLETGESPETVVLDLPAEEAESAGAAAGTDAKTEDLKRRLDARNKGQSPPPPTAAAEPSEKAPAPPEAAEAAAKPIREVTELPDPLSVDDERLFYQGNFYERNANNTFWRKVPPAPKQDTPTTEQGGAREGEGTSPGETAEVSSSAGTTVKSPAPPARVQGTGSFDFGGKP